MVACRPTRRDRRDRGAVGCIAIEGGQFAPFPRADSGGVASVGDRRSGHDETVTDVVIADDNMHFRSMRHEVFCLARKCE